VFLTRHSRVFLIAALASIALFAAQAARAAEKTSFKVAWSIYVGWMPWDYAQQSGILKKWADKYGIKIELTQINDYVESINQYTGRQIRCVCDDQHGHAHDSVGRGRGFDRVDRRRLLQRQ
jgi:ABC-type nitrate/sulfonate/bicarbonate transport system substrate-binding protein